MTMLLALLVIGISVSTISNRALSRQLDEGLMAALRLEQSILAAGLPIPLYRDWLNIEQFSQQFNRFVAIRDSAGRVIDGNTPVSPTLPLDSVAFSIALGGSLGWATAVWRNQTIRSVFAPSPTTHQRGAAVVQISASLAPLSETYRRSYLVMLGVVLLTALVTGLGAAHLARSSLTPVREITAQAQDIDRLTVGHQITAHANVSEYQGLVGVLNNMLDRLDRALRSQRQVIADAGHELRTPITAMRGQLEIALRGERTAEQLRGVLESCLEEVDHLGRISEDLLLLTRIEAGEVRPHLERIDLYDLVGNRAARANHRRGAREIIVETAPREEVAQVDTDLIGIVLDHLIGNAIQHTPPDTQISLRLLPADDVVTITVDDSGPGVPPEQLPYLFDRLYRVDEARVRTGRVGLGLAIVAAIVNAHGGEIHAERSDLGGLRVRVQLPRQPVLRASPRHRTHVSP